MNVFTNKNSDSIKVELLFKHSHLYLFGYIHYSALSRLIHRFKTMVTRISIATLQAVVNIDMSVIGLRQFYNVTMQVDSFRTTVLNLL